MSLNRYAKQRDDNEAEIVSALRDIPGCEVMLIDRPCDLLIGYKCHNLLLEIKHPKRVTRADQAEQRHWRSRWPGQIQVVTNVDEAVNCVLQCYDT